MLCVEVRVIEFRACCYNGQIGVGDVAGVGVSRDTAGAAGVCIACGCGFGFEIVVVSEGDAVAAWRVEGWGDCSCC